jgi:competence protein ComEC
MAAPVWLAVALLSGVCLVQLLPTLPPVWLSGLTLAGLALAWLRAPRARMVVAVLIGAAWAAAFGQLAMQARWPGGDPQAIYRIEGRVRGLPLRDEHSLRFDFAVEAGDREDLVGRRLRLGWYGQPPAMPPGSRWALSVRLKRPHGTANAGGFDAEKQALVQGIAAVGYVRVEDAPRRLAPGGGIDQWRERISAAIARALPNGRGRFVQALAIGDTRQLVDADWEILRSTGLTHQIAISGFHVGMVAGLGSLLVAVWYRLFPALGRRWPRPLAAATGAMAFAMAYTALAGFALPTVRTLLMIAVVLLARAWRRPQHAADAIGLAVIAVLVCDPLAVLTPGFWLSFVGVAWLLWCLPHERQAGFLREFLQAQGVAMLGLLPFTVWFFGQAALPGPLANVLGIPAISLVVVPLSLLGVMALPFSADAAGWLWSGAALAMDRLWDCLEAMMHWPHALIWLPEASLSALLLACAGAFWLLLPRGAPGKALAALLFLPLLWPGNDLPAPNAAEIVLIDVGQGTSVLVRTHRHALLLDAGPANERGLDAGEAIVVPALHALGISRLDRLILSHGDNDHAGGAAAVRRAFTDLPVFAPEGWAEPGMRLCQGGQRWRWDGVEFSFLHPPAEFPYLRNESSCVLRIEAGGHVALLPGDIGKHIEARLLRENAGRLRADLLLAPHHGSETSSTPAFLQAVQPRWVAISAGAENRFRLPRETVLARYRKAGARIANTADTGMLRFALGNDGVRLVEARRGQRRRYWRASPPAAQAMLSAIPSDP